MLRTSTFAVLTILMLCSCTPAPTEADYIITEFASEPLPEMQGSVALVNGVSKSASGKNGARLLTFIFLTPGAKVSGNSSALEISNGVTSIFELTNGAAPDQYSSKVEWDKKRDVVLIAGRKFERSHGALFVVIVPSSGAVSEVSQLASPVGLTEAKELLEFAKSELPNVQTLQEASFEKDSIRELESTILKSGQAAGSSGYLLRYKATDEPIRYHVIRQDRTIKTFLPEYTTNIDLELEVDMDFISDSMYRLKPSHVDGKDLNKTQTRHLKKIAKTIETESWQRKFDTRGSLGELEFVDYNPAGWAGMMAARGLGRYQHGFLGIRFPLERVEVGAIWIAPNDLAKESRHGFERDDSDDPLYENVKLGQTGGDAEYRLLKVEKRGDLKVAEISFSSKGVVTNSFDSAVMGSSGVKSNISEVGTIWIDLATGWPIKAKIVRREESTEVRGTVIDEYTTLVERI